MRIRIEDTCGVRLSALSAMKPIYLQCTKCWTGRIQILLLIVIGVGMADRLQAQSWTNTTLSAGQRATSLVNTMTFSEMEAMVYGGSSGGYAGVIPANSRLGIPTLYLQDGPAGIADGANNVTAFPAPITIAASWDVTLSRQFGSMMGAEAWGKGVNVLLAPMMNDARVYEDGRNFEGSGEDMRLSGAMSAAEIQGIQSQGVIATAKHFICNDQETQRQLMSADVDERTRQEVYYPAFRASVRAGVGAVMASYNRVNSRYACESEALNSTLKKLWGFNGFVMSDWGAGFSTAAAANNGLDMDMSSGYFTSSLLNSAISSGNMPSSEVSGMVQRTLTSMFQQGQFENPGTGNINSTVTSAAHAQFARDAAAQGTVLLQNNGDLLPLNTASIHSIAVIGSVASVSPISTGSGSAGVNLPYQITPLAGITNRASGGITVSYSQGDGASVSAAALLASNSDVAIVCVGQVTSEGSDRANLSLPSGQDTLISAVAAANPHTIVVIYSSSATLMPWANQVAGILFAWYPGQENGNALAQVLFGDVNPSGKLPITIPVSSSQVCASTPAQWPGVLGHSTYSEGLFVGYRWYDANNVTPLFSFGFGLSYTTFGYSNLTISAVSPSGQVKVGFDLTNTGTRTGAEVSELYLGFPAAAGEPPKLLKGFQKTTLTPGQVQHVVFNLNWEDLANWDATARGWIVTPGTFQVMVGASSRDLRLTGEFAVGSAIPSSDLANAALHQPVTVSSTLSTNTPGNAAVDGDAGSVWSSLASDPQWIAVDLGLMKDLSRVRLQWNTNYARSYMLQISPDGTTWTGIYSTNGGVGGVEDLLVSGRGRYIRVYATNPSSPGSGYSLSEFEVYSQPQLPFGNMVHNLPGRIEAEAYDIGGESVAYYNTTVGNTGGQYRSDDVGIEATADTGGGYDVGWLNSGEWLEYTVNLPNAEAICNLSLRVASASGSGQLRVRLDGTELGTVQIPNTGGWQTWQTVTLPNVPLPGGSGSKSLRLEIISPGFNLNWIQLDRLQVCDIKNVAQSQPVSASSLESASYPASAAVDGDPTTRWSSGFSDPQWITVDLGSIQNISRTRLVWETASAKSYAIQLSTDSNTWNTVYSTTNGPGGINDLAVLGSGRYVRVYSTQRNTSYGNSLWEFEVHPSSAAGGLVIIGTTTNQASPFTPNWPVATNSLIAGMLPSSVGAGSFTQNYNSGAGGGVSKLTDGVLGLASNNAGPYATCGYDNGAGAYVIYTLPATANGYNITNITTYSGWQDSGLSGQQYAVSYSTIDNPTSFVFLTFVNYAPGGSSPMANRVMLTDSFGGAIATDVAALKFDFTTPLQPYGVEAYDEITVEGTPAATLTPQPVVITTSNQTSASPFVPSWTVENNSLIAGMAPTATVGDPTVSPKTGTPFAGTSALTGGVLGVTGNYSSCAALGSGGGACSSLTYTLAGSTNGYDLTNIVTYTGWTDYGRDGQFYSVSYSTVAVPTIYIPLTAVEYNPYLTPLSTASANRVAIKSKTGVLARNVSSVKFDFPQDNTIDYGFGAYAEIVLQGTKSAPPTLPILGVPHLSSGCLTLTGTGGTPNSGYTWLATTNLSVPINWKTNSTGTLDDTGAFSNGIPISVTNPATFLWLRLP